MAAVQWSGGKMHGSVEAKASMLHDDKVMRLHHSHSNPDIDLSKTKQNFSLRELTYAQKCKRYDALMEIVKIKRKSSGKNANVTLQKLVIPIPAGMQHDDNIDMQMFRQWAADVGQILKDLYGDLLIDLDAHVDEVHLYLDSRKDEKDGSRYTWSRAHLHAAIVPAVWEPVKGADGKPMKDETGKLVRELCLNSTKFSNKRNIIRLNNRIQEMTQQKYHMLFMDGTGVGKKHNTVEEMKALSAEELRDAGYQIVSDKAEIEKARIQLESDRKDLEDREKESSVVLEKQAQALSEEHQRVQQQAQKLDEILNPEMAFERAASIVLQIGKMVQSPQRKASFGEVMRQMNFIKKHPAAKTIMKQAVEPVSNVWGKIAEQQKADIAASEERVRRIAAQFEQNDEEDEDEKHIRMP